MEALLVSPDYASDQTLFAGTGKGGVFITRDAGASWAPMNTGLLNLRIRSLALTPTNFQILLAGTEGSGIWKTNVPYPPTRTPTPTCTPTATPTPTSTPTPTATPTGPWLNWRDPEGPLLLPSHGATVDVVYGNIPVPATLIATLSGPAVFAAGNQDLTVDIANANGSYALPLKPAEGATLGDTFTLEVTLADLGLERVGTIARELYLPLMLK
ncbi:MAG: hypothetical protein H8D78_11915 [Chloroflexi bacterium]|nr:hypothetical protein [Chloroflexota bacterium]